MASTVRVLQFPGSTAIKEARYDIATRALTIRFPKSATTRTGKAKPSTWEFMGVEADDFAQFAIADSPGAYFNQNIRNVYPATRISPPPEPEDAEDDEATA
jgi:hypothetical protein